MNEPPRNEDTPASTREVEGATGQENPLENASSLPTQPLYSGEKAVSSGANALVDPVAAAATKGQNDTLRMPLGGRAAPPASERNENLGAQALRTPPADVVARAASMRIRRRPAPDPIEEADPDFDQDAFEKSFGENRIYPLFPGEEMRVKKEYVLIQVPAAPPVTKAAPAPAPPAIAANPPPVNPWSLPPAVASPVPATPSPTPSSPSVTSATPASPTAPQEAPAYHGLTPIVPSGPRAPSKKKIHPGAIAGMVGISALLVFLAGVIVNKSASKEDSLPITRPTAPIEAKPVTVLPDVLPAVGTIAPRPVEPDAPHEPLRSAPSNVHEHAPQTPSVARQETPKAEPTRPPSVAPPRDDVAAIVAVPKVSRKPQAPDKGDAGLPDIPDDFMARKTH